MVERHKQRVHEKQDTSLDARKLLPRICNLVQNGKEKAQIICMHNSFKAQKGKIVAKQRDGLHICKTKTREPYLNDIFKKIKHYYLLFNSVTLTNVKNVKYKILS